MRMKGNKKKEVQMKYKGSTDEVQRKYKGSTREVQSEEAQVKDLKNY